MKGFTLIEISLVVALTLIIGAVTMPSYTKFIDGRKLSADKSKLVENIRYARELAKSGKDNSSFGIYFQTSRYVLYQGSDYSSRKEPKDQTFELGKNIKLSNINEVNFAKKTGLPSTTGILKIENTNTEDFEEVEINQEGLIHVLK